MINASTRRTKAHERSTLLRRFALSGFLFPVCAFASIVLAPVAAHAQTCSAPMPFPLSPVQPSAAAWTCAEPAGLSLCSGTVITTNPSMVFNLTIGTGNTASLMAMDVMGRMNPYLYLTGPACGGRACFQGAGFLPLQDVAPGDYSLIVTASPIDAPGSCGDVTLFLDGDLAPVDRVFFDGFE